MKLQSLQFYINSKTIKLQRVKSVIIFGQMAPRTRRRTTAEHHFLTFLTTRTCRIALGDVANFLPRGVLIFYTHNHTESTPLSRRANCRESTKAQAKAAHTVSGCCTADPCTGRDYQNSPRRSYSTVEKETLEAPHSSLFSNARLIHTCLVRALSNMSART